MTQLLRKISTRTVFGAKSDVLELCFTDKTTQHLLYRVAGYCTSTRTGQTDEDRLGDDKKRDTRRDWTCLIGEFNAINAVTGEVFSSGQCFLPDYLTATVVGKLAGETEKVFFAFDIFAKFDKDSATSYVYIAVPVRPATEEKSALDTYMEGLAKLPSPASNAPALSGPDHKTGSSETHVESSGAGPQRGKGK